MNQFPKRLRELRLKYCLLQRELAEIAGIKIRAYQLYEQGKTEPSIDVLIKFADVFHVTLDDLVGREFTSPPPAASSEGFQTDPPTRPNA